MQMQVPQTYLQKTFKVHGSCSYSLSFPGIVKKNQSTQRPFEYVNPEKSFPAL